MMEIKIPTNPPKFYDGTCPKCGSYSTFRYEGIAPTDFDNIHIYLSELSRQNKKKRWLGEKN